ncbi:MAG: hypothetical protein IJ809_00510, partial [Clostridia bacterium]|nr:hypothetical protein [Clostridia bacterium]
SFNVDSEVKATCTSDGYVVYKCSVCGYSYKETTQKTGHDMDSGVVTTQPTCELAGTKTYTCKTCGYSETETIAAKGHSYATVYQKNDQSHWHECTVCGKRCDESVHSFDAGTLTTPATETSTGVKTYRCTVCGFEKTETVPMLEKQLGTITLKFGQGNYSAADTITVTVYFTKGNLNNLKVKFDGIDVNVSEVYRGDGLVILNISGCAGCTGDVMVEVSADDCETGYAYIRIDQ